MSLNKNSIKRENIIERFGKRSPLFSDMPVEDATGNGKAISMGDVLKTKIGETKKSVKAFLEYRMEILQQICGSELSMSPS